MKLTKDLAITFMFLCPYVLLLDSCFYFFVIIIIIIIILSNFSIQRKPDIQLPKHRNVSFIKIISRHTLGWLQLSADKSSVHVLQQNDALLWSHTQEVIQPIIRKTAVTQTHQTDAVTQLSSEGRAEKFNQQTNECAQAYL